MDGEFELDWDVWVGGYLLSGMPVTAGDHRGQYHEMSRDKSCEFHNCSKERAYKHTESVSLSVSSSISSSIASTVIANTSPLHAFIRNHSPKDFKSQYHPS